MKASFEKLPQASFKLAENMYKSQGGDAGADGGAGPSPGGAGPGAGKKGGDVIDADFEEA